ncbi:MAG: hypothetical protein KJ767_02855 [Nanoarchaeota archaeon]|nr:hypothetical protein [Nanoarchaeota archaeon]
MDKNLEQRVNDLTRWGSFSKAFEEKPYANEIKVKVANEFLKDSKNPENKAVIKEFAKMPQEEFYEMLQMNIGELQNKVLTYSKDNFNSVLNEIQDKDLVGLTAQALKPQVNGEITNKHKKYREAVETLQREDYDTMKDYLLDLVKDEYTDVFKYLLGDAERIKRMYSGVVQAREQNFVSEFVDENGDEPKINRAKIINYTKRNLGYANENEADNFYLSAAVTAVESKKAQDKKEKKKAA